MVMMLARNSKTLMENILCIQSGNYQRQANLLMLYSLIPYSHTSDTQMMEAFWNTTRLMDMPLVA